MIGFIIIILSVCGGILVILLVAFHLLSQQYKELGTINSNRSVNNLWRFVVLPATAKNLNFLLSYNFYRIPKISTRSI